MNQGVHNVDLLQWLVGPVHSVTAQSATLAHGADAEDTTVATVQFCNGALGMISTSTATPPGSPAVLTIHAERGVVELGQGEITRWEVEGVPEPDIGEGADAIGVGASDPAAIGVEGHVNQWVDLLEALRDGREPSITGRDGAETVLLIQAIATAAASGRRICLEELR